MLLRPLLRRVLVAAAFLALVTAPLPSPCRAEVRQDGSIYLPLVVHTVPGPLSVQVGLDRGHSIQQDLPPSGGVIKLAGSGGTQFSLTVPDGALMVTSTVTMTVIGTIPNLPFGGGLAAGVQLEPSGLQLLRPAVLEIQGGPAVAPDSQAFFAYDESGTEFRLHPPYWDQANLARTALLVSHFSGYGLASGTDAERQGMLSFPPSNAANQIRQQVAALIGRERAAQLAHRPGDPQFWSKLEALTRRWYTEYVSPTLEASLRTLCKGIAGERVIERALSDAFEWRKSVELLGLGDAMASEHQDVWDSMLTAMHVCWNDATQPCVDWHNPAQVQRVIAYARQAMLLSLPQEQFNPYTVRKCSGCEWVKAVTDWSGSVNFTYHNLSSRTEYGTTTTADVSRSASMSFGMARAANWGGRERWDNSSGPYATGAGTINDIYVSSTKYGSSTQSWVSTGGLVEQGYGLASYAKLSIDATACNYSIEFHPILHVIYTNAGSVSPLRTDGIASPYVFQLAVPPNSSGRIVSNSLKMVTEVSGASENTYTHLLRGPNGAAAELEFGLGAGNLGSTLVTWTFNPANFWATRQR